MSTQKNSSALLTTYEDLENRVNELIRVCTALKLENRNLRLQHKKLSAEHTQLIERNQTAAARIESMVNPSQSLERST